MAVAPVRRYQASEIPTSREPFWWPTGGSRVSLPGAVCLLVGINTGVGPEEGMNTQSKESEGGCMSSSVRFSSAALRALDRVPIGRLRK